MTTMNISLPDEMKAFIEDQIAREGYASASEYFRDLVREAQRRKAKLELEVKLIGDRPGGATPPTDALVRLAVEATRALGARPFLDCSSTDSNIAISRGLPAVTIGAGGSSGNTHTLDEWYDPRGRDAGLKRALLVVLGTVGLA